MLTVKSKTMQNNKSYQLWRKCMVLGEHIGCHQLPERSFFFCGYQMPVCARCTGVVVGYLLAIPSYILFGFQFGLSLLGCVLMFIDWFLQFIKYKPSTNNRRLLTGIFGGFGIMSIELFLIVKAISLCNVFFKRRR